MVLVPHSCYLLLLPTIPWLDCRLPLLSILVYCSIRIREAFKRTIMEFSIKWLVSKVNPITGIHFFYFILYYNNTRPLFETIKW